MLVLADMCGTAMLLCCWTDKLGRSHGEVPVSDGIATMLNRQKLYPSLWQGIGPSAPLERLAASAGRLSKEDAGAVAELPLPPQLERLRAVFAAINVLYSFLMLQNIQACQKSYLSKDFYVQYSCPFPGDPRSGL